LANVEEFCVEDSSNTRFIFGVMDHDVCTVLVLSRSFRVSLILHISRQ
jgi:hypothetical protein